MLSNCSRSAGESAASTRASSFVCWLNDLRAVFVGNVALMSYAAPLVLFAVAAPAAAVVVGYGIAAACLGFLNPIWETVVQQEIPAEVLARVSAYDWLVSMCAMPLGYALGPILSREFGYTWPLAGAAAIVVLTLLVPVSMPDVRNLRLRRTSGPVWRRPGLRARCRGAVAV